MPAPQLPSDASADRFAVCVARLLTREGGFVNHPADRGGPTNHGISLAFLRAHADDHLVRQIFGRTEITVEHVRALEAADAVDLYRRYFWDRNLCGAMPPPLDGAVFDQVVNGGGAFVLQRTLNLFYHGALAVDGNIGGRTLTIVDRAARDPFVGVDRLIASFRTVAEHRYRDLARVNPDQAVFLAGWLARARSLGDV